MRVTDEIWERFRAHLDTPIPTLRDALEAALADVPEPGPVALENFLKGKLESERADRAEARIAELEAQLARVETLAREWEEHADAMGALSPKRAMLEVHAAELRAILDGKEAPRARE